MKDGLRNAVGKIMNYPNVTSALKLAYSDNLLNLRNLADKQNSLIQIIKETVNNSAKEKISPPSEPSVFNHIYVKKSKIPKCPPAYEFRKITKENAGKLIELLRQSTAPPQSKLYTKKDDDLYYCTFQDCPKRYHNINSTVRHARQAHYKSRQYKCLICKDIFDRRPICIRHMTTRHIYAEFK